MNVEEFREYCLSFRGVREKMPFPNVADRYSRDVLCFYVGDKWFCFVNVAVFDFCCIKCDPDWSGELQARGLGDVYKRQAHEQKILDQRLFRAGCPGQPDPRIGEGFV